MNPFGRLPAWITDVLIGVVVLAAALAPFGNAPRVRLDPLVLCLIVLPALVLPLRRRWPVAVYAACGVLFCAGFFVGLTGPGAVFPVAVAMFGLAVRRDRRTTIVAATSVILVTIVLLCIVGGPFLDLHAIQVAVTIAFAAAAGGGTRARHAYIAAITDRAVRAEETRESEARRRVAEDRLRIAQDLHDVVAHEIAVISLNAGLASTTMQSKPETAAEALVTIRRAARSVLTEIGDLLTTLRTGPDGTDPVGTDPVRTDPDGTAGAVLAPTPGLARLDELVARFAESGLEVTTRVEGPAVPLPAATDVVAYRVIQEALTNAHKHGRSGRAHVRVHHGPEQLEIVVTNPIVVTNLIVTIGDTSQTQSPPPSTGHGLRGIRERVQSVRGIVDVHPTRSTFRLRVVLPVGDAGSDS